MIDFYAGKAPPGSSIPVAMHLDVRPALDSVDVRQADEQRETSVYTGKAGRTKRAVVNRLVHTPAVWVRAWRAVCSRAMFHPCLLAETFRCCRGQHTLSSQPATKRNAQAIYPLSPPPAPPIPRHPLPTSPWFFECSVWQWCFYTVFAFVSACALLPSSVRQPPWLSIWRSVRAAGAKKKNTGGRRPDKNVLQQGGPPVSVRRAGRVQERPRAPAAGAGRAPLGRTVTTVTKNARRVFGGGGVPAFVLSLVCRFTAARK